MRSAPHKHVKVNGDFLVPMTCLLSRKSILIPLAVALYAVRHAAPSPIVSMRQFSYTEDIMSKECDFCGKKPQVGNLVSHSNIKTKRRFNPNLQKVRHQFPNGAVRTMSVCTRCLRSGVVVKPVVRKAS